MPSRSIAHLKPRYLVDRSKVYLDQTLRPHDPWLTRESIGLIERLLRPSDIAVEFGSGRSTLWFAKRVARITSYEHDTVWFAEVSEKIRADGIGNVELIHRPLDVPESEGAKAAYVQEINNIQDSSVDVVLVDGFYRGYCSLHSVPKVKTGGIIILDNANWYLPSTSLSPASCPHDQPPISQVWQEFADRTKNWRRIWTSNGVSDTLLLFKS
jgi:predicted O-methyltransferase YrrM